MEKEEKRMFNSIKRATILSGIGMGLLLGIIIGLSVSEVVKVIMGALTALLGAFLGFDKRSFTGMSQDEYQKENQIALFTALRTGWFGLAVVAGIFFGLWIRTHDVFTLSVAKSVKQWTDAGYDSNYARKLVTFQRLAIDPNTGHIGPTTEIQKKGMAVLFSSAQAESLCNDTDPDQWINNSVFDWSFAKKSLLNLKNPVLTSLAEAIENNIPTEKRYDFLSKLNDLLCYMGKNDTKFTKLGSDLNAWSSDKKTAPIAGVIVNLPAENQNKMMESLAVLVDQLEKATNLKK